ncbi:hypothetical protein ACS3UN_11995 [Oscillospiraceae bacterium LTW-04]|nr:hypothetical protein RBH76_13735 [Oscillospiraceae bacterium MB24-C1]
MSTGVAVFLFMVGLAGAFFSFKAVSKRKRAKKKAGAAVAVCIAFCLMAVLSVFYLAAALLLIGNIH